MQDGLYLFHQTTDGRAVLIEHHRNPALLEERFVKSRLQPIAPGENQSLGGIAPEHDPVVANTEHHLFRETTQQRPDCVIHRPVNGGFGDRPSIGLIGGGGDAGRPQLPCRCHVHLKMFSHRLVELLAPDRDRFAESDLIAAKNHHGRTRGADIQYDAGYRTVGFTAGLSAEGPRQCREVRLDSHRAQTGGHHRLDPGVDHIM